MNHTRITKFLYVVLLIKSYLIFLNQTLHYPREYDIIVSMSLARLYGACRYAYNWVIGQREIMRTRRASIE